LLRSISSWRQGAEPDFSHFPFGYLLVVIDLPEYETVALFTLDTGSR
jgi:hypothetical protein